MAGVVNPVRFFARSCALSGIVFLAISAVSQQLPTAPPPQQK
jgi:hypothetical protein